MEQVMQKLNLKKLDKSTWKSYRFDEIAYKISETVKPEEADVDVYVGLEHLDAEDIHIRRRGVPADVKGGKLRCYPGDVIFGKRRAYQRKAAIVDFEGICSAHAFVFRANDKVIEPKLLPFFLHSDEFMHRMVDISVGGLSPTINWGDLKHQEFLLPPKEEQARLAHLLWAMDEVIENGNKLVSFLKRSKRSFFKPYRRSTNYGALAEFATVSYGFGQPPKKDPLGIPMIRATDIKRGRINADDFLRISEDEVPKNRDVRLVEGDIIIVRSGAYTGDLAMIPKEFEEAVAGYDLVIRPDRSLLNPLWLQEYLLEHEAQNYFKGESIRSAQPHLNSKQVLSTKIPCYPIQVQNEISEVLRTFDENLTRMEVQVLNSQFLQKSLINQIF